MKKNVIQYFTTELFLAVMVFKITSFKNNIFFLSKIAYQFGMLIITLQSYSIFNIFSLIINKKLQKNNKIDFYILFTVLIRILLKIIKIISKDNDISKHLIHQSKIIFVISFTGYFVVQFYYIIPILFHTYYYLKSYPVKDQLISHTKCFFYIFLIKIIAEYYQMFFLEYFRVLLYEYSEFFNDVWEESNIVYSYIHICSIVPDLFLAYFIFKISKINKKTEYISKHIALIGKNSSIKRSDTILLSISRENIYLLIKKSGSHSNFILNITLDTIKKKFNIDNKDILIHQLSEDASLYNFFLKRNYIPDYLENNDLLLYDYLYEIKETSLLINDNNTINFQKKHINNIITDLDILDIRIIYAIKLNQDIKGLIIIKKDSFSTKKHFTIDELLAFIPFAQSLYQSAIKKLEESFFSHFQYEKKISELTIQENYSQEKNTYNEVNSKIGQIEQIFVYENKKTIKTFFTKELTSLISDIQKNHLQKIEDKKTNSIQIKLLEIMPHNYAHCILTNESKIPLPKLFLSFYLFFPFLKKSPNTNSIIFSHTDNINNNIFPICSSSKEHIDFLNTFDLGFKIKIIIFEDAYSKSFIKIIKNKFKKNIFFLDITKIKSIDDITKIINELNYKEINQNETYIHIILNEFYKKTTQEQDLFYTWHKNFILKSLNLNIKFYIFIEKKKEKQKLSINLFLTSEVINLKNIFISDFSNEDQILLLKNYFLIIDNTTILEKNIIEYLSEHKESLTLYKFIDKMSIAILFYQYENTYDKKFIMEAIKLKKNSLNNIFLMHKIRKIFLSNKKKIANLIGVHRSTISRFYKKDHC